MRTDGVPSRLRSSPSTCWCRWRVGSARPPGTPASSTGPASTTCRCAGPASPTTPSWPSDEPSGGGGHVGRFEAVKRFEVGHQRLSSVGLSVVDSPCVSWSSPVMFSDVTGNLVLQMKTFPGLKLLLGFIFVYKSHTCAYLWRSNDSHYFATTRIILSYSIDSVFDHFFYFQKVSHCNDPVFY